MLIFELGVYLTVQYMFETLRLPLLRNATLDRRVINPVKTIHTYILLLHFRGIVCTDAQPTNRTTTIQTARYTNNINPFAF